MERALSLQNDDRFIIRDAETDDLDDIVEMHLDGFVDEPMDDYCYPSRFDHYHDHFTWMRVEYEYYLENRQKYRFLVAESRENPEKGRKKNIIAFAVWNVSVLANAPPLNRGFETREDAIKNRVDAYSKVVANRYKAGGCMSQWGGNQMTLLYLTVGLKFRRQGVAASLVAWGYRYARERVWHITACTSQMGADVGVRLGFQRVGVERIQIHGDKESFTSAVMAIFPI